ncbi:MAG: hypothetical protein WD648_03080 [Planctomycetaceae bacterium]
MGRRAHIWFWKKRRVWCVDIDRRRINLGPDKREAERQFHALKAKPKKVIPKNGLCVLIDEFLGWVSLNRSADTLEWYTRRLRAFDGLYPDLRVDELKSFHVRRWIDSYPKLSSWSKRNQRHPTRAHPILYRGCLRNRAQRVATLCDGLHNGDASAKMNGPARCRTVLFRRVCHVGGRVFTPNERSAGEAAHPASG